MTRRLLHIFPGFGVGGSQRRLAVLANHFGDAFSHDIISLDTQDQALSLFDPQIQVKLITDPGKKGQLLHNIRQYRSFLKHSDYDLILTYNWGAIEWALANMPQSIPHIHVEDGFGPDEAHQQITRRVWTRRLALSGKTLVIPSLTLDNIAKKYWRPWFTKIRYIANGIDLERFNGLHKPKIRPDFIPETGPVIVSIAGLRPEKNLERLIKAFQCVHNQQPNAHLLLIGDGTERTALETLTHQLKLQDAITFAGYYPSPEHILPFCDIVALSSDTEQAPISILEGMATKLPIAATDVGDIRHMVAPSNQPFICAPTINALSDSLLQLITQPEMAHAIGQDNHTHTQTHFSLPVMLTAWQDIFLLKSH